MTLNELLSEYEDGPALAKGLNVSLRTIRRYELEPDGLPFVRVGKQKRYRIAAVQKWLAEREHKPNPRRTK